MLRENLARLLSSYFSKRGVVAVAVFAAIVVITMTAVQPLLIQVAIDQAMRAGGRGQLVPLAGALIGASLVKALGVLVRKRQAMTASISTEARLRAELYEHLQNLDVTYHERTPVGQLMSRASSDIQAVREFLSLIPISIGMFLLLAVVAVILFLKDPALAAVSLAGLPFMGVLGARLTRRLHPLVSNTQQHLAELTAVAEETVTGIRVVKAFGREPLQVERLEKDAGRVFSQATEAVRLRAVLQPVFEFFPAISMAVVVWYGGHRVVAGHITPGEFVAFFVYLYQLGWPIRMLGWLASDGRRAVTASGRIFEVLDEPPGIADRPDARSLHITTGEIRFEAVSYGFGSGRLVVDGVELHIPSGGSVALVGPTGCGKSTVLRLILRFLEPVGGRILIDGTDIREVTLLSLRAQIGTVFEDTFLFSDTIRSNIAFARPDATEDEIVQAAALAQAHGFISELPDGYDTVVGEQGFTLSGGQRQRVAIARAILMDPKVLLLDDATSAVDPEVEAEIRRGLSEAMHGRTTLIVARRPTSAALAGRVVYMEEGRIVESGTHDELWERFPAYRETLAGAGARVAAVSDPKVMG